MESNESETDAIQVGFSVAPRSGPDMSVESSSRGRLLLSAAAFSCGSTLIAMGLWANGVVFSCDVKSGCPVPLLPFPFSLAFATSLVVAAGFGLIGFGAVVLARFYRRRSKQRSGRRSSPPVESSTPAAVAPYRN